MPRRFFEPWVYHVYNRWLNKMNIFNNLHDFERFYKVLIKYSNLDKYKNIKILSYSFLPNHFHFLLSNPGVEISNFMWDVQNAYSKYFNIKYDRKWQLFEWRFKAKYIKDELYLAQCLTYVNYNAVKYNIVNNINDYPRTSYHQLENKDKIDQYKDLVLSELEF